MYIYILSHNVNLKHMSQFIFLLQFCDFPILLPKHKELPQPFVIAKKITFIFIHAFFLLQSILF